MYETNNIGNNESEGITRRDFLKWGAAAGLGMSALSIAGFPDLAEAQKIPGSKSTLDNTKATKGGTLRYRFFADPPTLDPNAHISFATYMFSGQVYNKLVRYDFGEGVDPLNRGLVPDLAEKWEQPDELTYKFHLKKGVKFHNLPPVNGRELISDDIKFSLERHLNPAVSSPVRHYFSELASIDLPDKHTVILKTKQPFSPMINYLASNFSWIVAKEVIERDGDAKKTSIGTGPFILEEYVRNNKIAFKKNPDYHWNAHPHVDKLEFLIIKDHSQSMAAMRAKQLDINYLYDKMMVDELKKTNPETKVLKLAGASLFIMFNTEKPPLDNIKVRQAINHAINRQAINDSVYFGDSGFTSMIPTVLPEWTLSADESAHLYRYDPALAKKLMAASGLPKGTEITMNLCEIYGPHIMDTGVLIQENLKEIGIKGVINRLEYGAYLKAWPEGTFQINLGPQVTFIEPDEWTYGQFHSQASRNYSKVKDKDLDKKLEEQRRLFDKVKRKKLLDEIQRELAEKAYQLPLTYGVGYYCMQPYVKNFEVPFWYGLALDDTWLEKA
ncbi:MAG: twin-arginine translocation signal domain-containing protein [Candidatus Tectomicrobia bacterium]|uniref:Twin-arginine translocation signal domain-containing protein n=1 Tax=Tectimicrobiota bacterium TaxID=2528274 RepID=A0A933GN00_UNCTE|nr:twin-arginine translocation signal domain-containing protein [Candidatus Tectomicrobia bacterium]